MSFSITAAGTVDQVRAQLAQRHDQITAHGTDHSQYEAVHQLIQSELDGWPPSTNPDHVTGLHVEANGHHDTYSGRSLSITIRPLWLPKVDE